MDAVMEYKAVPVEFKAGKNEGEYEGYFSIFGNVDDGMDVMMPGAFTKTLQERKKRIKVFYAHDWQKLIGPPPSEIFEDSKGLYAKGRLTLGSFWGKEVWELMKDDALTEGSIGFQTVKADYSGNDGARRLHEVKLYEISPVPLGMNPLTEIQAIKSLRGTDPARYLATVHALLAELKAGARHSKADVDALNAIHDYAVTLGCTTCAGAKSDSDEEEDTEKAFTRADGKSLALQRRARAAGQALLLAGR